MTLRRQLLIAISILFLLVFAGLQTLSILSTKDFLQQQLSSHAQDAASSLSHTLVEPLAANDRTLAEIQIAAMFDRGYYRQIILLSPDGKQVINKELPENIENVPVWFSSLLSLDTPPGQVFITSGWKQLGKLVVVSQPTFAYQYLWTSVKQTTWWLIAMCLLAWMLMILFLRIILAPLQAIENAAIDIQGKRFTKIEVLPGARELRRVVLAMNAMSGKISEILDAEMQRAEAYRKDAYTDKVTGLENRQGFDLRFDHLLADKGSFTSASIVVLEFDGLKEFNNEHGYRSGDNVLKGATAIVGAMADMDVRIAGRIGGTAFAFVSVNRSASDSEVHVRAMQAALSTYLDAEVPGKTLSFSIGSIAFTPAQSRGDIFAKVDLALETARQQGRNNALTINFIEEAGVVEGSLGWRTLIQNALAESRWALVAQPVLALSSGVLYQHEIFSRLIDTQGNFVPAAKFMPMALRHQLMEDIDRAIITLIFDLLSSEINRYKKIPIDVTLQSVESLELMMSRVSHYKDIAVNISVQSIESSSFKDWLSRLLDADRGIAQRLSVELSEFSCVKDIELTREFVTLLRSFGVRFGIDHFGLDPHALEFLREVPPDYIKLDGGLVRGMAENPSGHEHVRAIIKLAHSLEIPVIAQNVESEEMQTMLLLDAVEYGQGYFLGTPQPA